MLVAKGIGVIITTSDFARMLPYLDLCMSSLFGQQAADFEVVLSCMANERQAVEIPPHWPARLTVVHTPDARPDDVGWCASRARNAGAMHCPREYLLFTDGDLIFPRNALNYVQSQLDLGAFVRFAVGNATVGFEATEQLAREIADPRSVPVCGGSHGAVAVTRSAWEACGGYDEEFRGWGGDDQEFFERATRLTGKITADSAMANVWLLHLRHPAWTPANHDVPGKKRNNDMYWASTRSQRKAIPVVWGGLNWRDQ